MRLLEIINIFNFILTGILIVAMTYGVSNLADISNDAKTIALSIVILSAVIWMKETKVTTIIKENEVKEMD